MPAHHLPLEAQVRLVGLRAPGQAAAPPEDRQTAAAANLEAAANPTVVARPALVPRTPEERVRAVPQGYNWWWNRETSTSPAAMSTRA